MASVTGVTAAKLNEVKNNTIVSARVQNGVLYFLKGDGVTEFSVGRIVPFPYESWPVGSVFITESSVNPATLLAGGTWQRYAQGRVLMGLNESNTKFNTVHKTGGAETVALSITEMPGHDHGGSTGYQSHDHTHTGYAHPNGQHTHTQALPNHRGGISGGGGLSVSDNSNYYPETGAAGYHDHSVTTYGASQNHYHGITAQGGGGAHENLPPYTTVYMWRRTA